MTEHFLKQLLNISLQLAQIRALAPLLDYVIQAALELMAAQHGYLILLSSDQKLDFRVNMDKYGNQIENPQAQINPAILQEVLTTKKPLVILDHLDDDARSQLPDNAKLRFRGVMCVPLTINGSTLGVIYIENRSEAEIFATKDVAPLAQFALQSAIFIKNAIANDDLTTQVKTRMAELSTTNALLQESEQRLAEIQRIAQVGSWEYNFTTREMIWSAETFRIAGLEGQAQPPSYDDYLAVVHHDDRPILLEKLGQARRETAPFELELRHLRPNRTFNHTIIRGEPIVENNRVIGFIGSALDMTERRLAEEALKESQDLFASFMDKLPHGVFIKDEALKIVYINQHMKEVFNTQSWLRNNAYMAFPENVAKTMLANDRRALQDGQIIIEETAPDKNGVEHIFRATKFRIDRGKKPPLLGGIGIDITDLRKTEEQLRTSKAELQALFDGMSDVVMMIDKGGRILKIAPTSPELLYQPVEDIINKTIHEIFPKKGADMFLDKIYRSLAMQQTVGFEYMLEISGEQLWFDGRVSPMSEDSVVFVARDITERKRAMEAAEQARQIAEQARQAAEVANEAKSIFLANMSHELRTPLNAILGFGQVLQRDTTLTAPQRENLSIINRSGEYLLVLINDILEMSKIEAGRTTFNKSDFDLYQLLNDLENMFRLKAKEKALQLDFIRITNVPQYICTDESKLRQVLINLLSNAIKFTEKGRVLIQVSLVTNEMQTSSDLTARTIQFEITDTGPGIAFDEIDTIFEPFRQTNQGRYLPQGTGLGLPISYQFVQLLGGELKVQSPISIANASIIRTHKNDNGYELLSDIDRAAEAPGTTFKFHIQCTVAEPRRYPPTNGQRRIIGLEPNQSVYRLLVVEDNVDNRKLLVELLEPLGFEIREAWNGQEGVEVWQTWQPDLIWMDIQMPVMDGYEAIKTIKATSEGQATTIIALTAGAFDEERDKVIASGCDDFIRKPFQAGEIFAKLEQHLQVRYLYEQSKDKRYPAKIKGHTSLEKLQSELATIPLELLSTLDEATKLSNMTLIEETITEICRLNAPLAAALATIAANFEYEKLLALTQLVIAQGQDSHE